MMQEEQFVRLLQLHPSKERYVTKKGRPLTINIDLKPVEPNNGQPWTPKTPCSMLSPLAPKTPCSMLSPLTPKQGRKLEWQRSVDRTPKSAKREIDLYKEQLHPLMVFDVCSPLGKRISNNLEELVKNHQIPIIRDYERLCNPQSSPEEEETRKLRAVSGEHILLDLAVATIHWVAIYCLLTKGIWLCLTISSTTSCYQKISWNWNVQCLIGVQLLAYTLQRNY